MPDLDPDGALMKLLTSWGPPVITVIIGGALASLLFPRWQNRAAQAKTFNERRFALMEEIADLFPRYIASWRRLMQISTLEQTRPLDEAETKRKMDFVAQRSEARDALCSALNRGQIYFSEDTWGIIQSFLIWDEGNTAKRLEDLPDVSEWRSWESRILRSSISDAH